MRFRTAALGLFLVACYSSGEGISPPLERIYFPVGLAIDKDQNRLYVASSDFDLQYNAGSVQVLDLERIRQIIPRECERSEDCKEGIERCDAGDRGGSFLCVPKSGPFKGKPCGALGEQTFAERVTVPGRCGYLDLMTPVDEPNRAILVDSVGIGAFAADLEIKYYGPDHDQGRLLIPVRGESALYWLDLESGSGLVKCGQDKQKRCADRYRVGTQPDENKRQERMPPEPFGIATSTEGDAILVTHQTTGQVSLFYQDLSRLSVGPQLEYVQGNLPTQALAIAAAPSSEYVSTERMNWMQSAEKPVEAANDPFPPGFLVAYRNAAQVDLLRFYADDVSRPVRPYLQLAASTPITANSVSRDTRGIAFDDTERKACELACRNAEAASETRTACLAECAAKPIGVYLVSRSPASLLVGETVRDTWLTPNRDLPHFSTVVPLPSGPSRVYVNKIVGEDGQLETRVFVVCFDASTIAIYNPRTNVLEDFISTGRGPHAIAFDNVPGTEARALAYVAHFTDSYVGVVELDSRKLHTYGKVVLNLGPAIAPRASK